MASNNSKIQEVKNMLKEQANTQSASEKSPVKTVMEYLKKMTPELHRALPKHMNPDRLARIALTTIRTNPKLLECSTESLLGAVMQSVQLGLEPGLLGHCYLIPFKDWNTGESHVQFQIGKGTLTWLAGRANWRGSRFRPCAPTIFFHLSMARISI